MHCEGGAEEMVTAAGSLHLAQAESDESGEKGLLLGH